MQALAKPDASAAAAPAAQPEPTVPVAAVTAQTVQTTPAAIELHEGCRVLVNGLQARPDVNGCRCKGWGAGLFVCI